MPKADIAIITVIVDEYAAVVNRLEKEGCRLTRDLGSARQPNRYGWMTGDLADDQGRVYQIVLAATISAGPTHMANAVNATLARFKPRHVLIVGIAGGFALDGLARGDVVVSSVIYDYEYGKIANGYQPRHDNTYQVDGTLYRSALTLDALDTTWTAKDESLRPSSDPGKPKIRNGAVASGSKVVDNAEYDLFARVLASWPKLVAVEMEGAGAVATINEAVSGGSSVGFLMIRGISDMPKVGTDNASVPVTPSGNTAERDTWKKYAAAVAASFTVHWIKRGWPFHPGRRSGRASGTPAGNDDEDGQVPPTAVTRPRGRKSVNFEPFARNAQSSAWLNFLIELAPNAASALEGTRGDPASMLAALRALAGHRETVASSGNNGLDSDLDVIKSHLDKHETEVAEAKLKEIEFRAADRLGPSQWYQIKALRSQIYSSRAEWERAGRELLDAKRHMPETERARVNEALGYELLGDRERAHSLAMELRSIFPHSVKLLTILVRTAAESEPFDSLCRSAEQYAKDDEELNLALTYRAISANRFEDAVSFARRATELDTSSPHAWFVRGEATHALAFQLGTKNPVALYRDAKQFYDRAAQLAQREKLTGIEAVVRFNRAKIRHLLGESGAEADFERAIELGRPKQGFRAGYAGYLLQTGRPADAIRELESASGEKAGECLFFEAAARYERNAPGDRGIAQDLLRKLIDAGQSERWDDAHIVLVQWAVQNSTQQDARVILTRGALRETNPLVFHTLEGWLAQSEGDNETARASLRRAIHSLGPTARRDHIFLLAQTLSLTEEDDLALPLLERCYRPGVFDEECKKLLGAAKRLDRHDVSRRVCKDLREAGATDPRVIETEVSVLQLYDPQEALRVASEYLARDPRNRHVALWQSALALRLDRPALVISDLSRLPTVKDVTPEGSGLVVSILANTGQHAAALRYAYDALRAHFESEFAHGQYLACFLKHNEHCPELRSAGRADPGAAVCYREDRDEIDHWAIIEDGPNPDLARNEYPPEHPVSKAIAGHKVGDTVAISAAGLQPRTITIRQAFHKFIYRYQDCRDRYQLRFPGGSAVQLIHVGNGDEFDPSPIIESLEDRRRHVEQIDKAYHSGPMPFPMYAELVGRDEFQAWGHLVSDANLGIRCGDGDGRDLRTALDLVKASKSITLDMTAIITLAHLDILKLVQGGARRLVVSQTTFERIQHLAQQANDDWGNSSSVVLAPDGGLARLDEPADVRNKRVQLLTALRDGIREGCDVRPCPQAAALDPHRREQFIQIMGRPSLDAILLATDPNAVLWTDDHVLGVLGRTDHQIRRVWTQAVLFILQEEGTITPQAYDQAIARLVGWHYKGISLNEDTLLAAADVAGWQMDRWPVPAVMRTLSEPKADALMRLRVAAAAIKAVWQRDLPYHSRQAFLFAVLGGFRSERLVKRLHKGIPSVFSVDVLSADEVMDCILVWLRHPTGLILP